MARQDNHVDSAITTDTNSEQTQERTGKAKSPTTKPGASWRRTFSSLRHRDFLLFWLGMLGIMAGMQMQMLARSYLVYDITGSASLLGLVAAGNALPMLGFSLFGGAFADRFDRRRIIQVGQASFALLALAVAIFIVTDRVTWVHLLIAAVVQGVAFSFMMPARQSIIPQLVPPEQITNAMALSSAAMSAMTLLAPFNAGIIYGYAGPATVYFVIAGMGFAAIAFTSLISAAGTNRKGRNRGSVVKDIGAGLSYIRSNNIVLVLLILGLSTTVLAQPFRMLMPLFIVDVYELGVESMGLMVSAMGLASLVGALFVASISNWRRGMLLLIGSFMSGIALVLIASVPIYYAAVFFMIPLGLGDAGRRTLNQSLVMEEADDEYRGRVMSVFMLNRGMMPLGVLPTAIVADYVGAQVAIGALGVLLLGFTIVVTVTQKRLREMP
ncbi:MAG: MFS transporter [SAR202 cluster bacterium]|nr:MFS transporter [SAR202 cluster bacterium]MDP6714526.1 MFS transporter [SAR202 cluster bacterium]